MAPQLLQRIGGTLAIKACHSQRIKNAVVSQLVWNSGTICRRRQNFKIESDTMSDNDMFADHLLNMGQDCGYRRLSFYHFLGDLVDSNRCFGDMTLGIN